jgi:hypothetical protein
MKKMNKLTVAALALVSMGFAATAASAQTVTTTPGDLILGFEITAAPNASPTDLEIDLGPESQFIATSTINLSSKLNVNDLISTFGATWSSNVAGVGASWGAAADIPGGTGFNANNLILTSTAAKPNGVSYSTLHGYYGDISGLTNNSDSINGKPVAGTSSSALLGNSGAPASGIADSWTSQRGNLTGLNQNIEQTGAGTDELYEYIGNGTAAQSSTVDLGTLTLSPTGALTFTGSAAAVPEPSAYALGICAVLLFIVLRRRATVA